MGGPGMAAVAFIVVFVVAASLAHGAAAARQQGEDLHRETSPQLHNAAKLFAADLPSAVETSSSLCDSDDDDVSGADPGSTGLDALALARAMRAQLPHRLVRRIVGLLPLPYHVAASAPPPRAGPAGVGVGRGGGGGSSSRDGVSQAMRCLTRALFRRVLRLLPFRYKLLACRGGGASPTLCGASGTAGVRLEGHLARVVGARAFPFGSRALTWSADATAIVWDTESGELISKLYHPGRVVDGQVFPDGSKVVTRIADGTSIVWDAILWLPVSIFGGQRQRPNPLFERSLIGRISGGVEVLPGGDRVLTWGRRPSATIWHALASQTLCALRGHLGAVTVGKAFPDGEQVITGGLDGRAILWSASTCEALRTFEDAGALTALAVLESGRMVVSASSHGATLWDAATGKRLRPLGGGPVRGLEAFPDGRRIATYGPAGAAVWSAGGGAPPVFPRGGGGADSAEGVAVAPGGDIVATCGAGGRVAVWSATSGEILHSFVLEAASDDEDDEDDAATAPSPGRPRACVVAFAITGALAPGGLGRGATLQDLRAPLRVASPSAVVAAAAGAVSWPPSP